MLKTLFFPAERSSIFVRFHLATTLQVLIGACYFTLLSQVYLPLEFVKMTLQTFAIFTMALYLGKNKAACSVLAFLAAGTLGLPVFPGLQSESFWFLMPKAGFYISFPVAAYVIGTIAGSCQPSKMWRMVLAVLSGQCVIYSLGIFVLSLWFGFDKALHVGLYPFMAIAPLKLLAAVTLKKSTDAVVECL